MSEKAAPEQHFLIGYFVTKNKAVLCEVSLEAYEVALQMAHYSREPQVIEHQDWLEGGFHQVTVGYTSFFPHHHIKEMKMMRPSGMIHIGIDSTDVKFNPGIYPDTHFEPDAMNAIMQAIDTIGL